MSIFLKSVAATVLFFLFGGSGVFAQINSPVQGLRFLEVSSQDDAKWQQFLDTLRISTTITVKVDGTESNVPGYNPETREVYYAAVHGLLCANQGTDWRSACQRTDLATLVAHNGWVGEKISEADLRKRARIGTFFPAATAKATGATPVAAASAVATVAPANGMKPEQVAEIAKAAARGEVKGLDTALAVLNSQVAALKGDQKKIEELRRALQSASTKAEIKTLKTQLTAASAQMEEASRTFKTSQEGLSAMMANLPAETRGIAEQAVKEGLKAIKVDIRPWYLKYAVEVGLGILSVFVGIAFFLILSNRKVMKNEIGKQIKVAAKPILQMAGDAHTAAIGAHGVAIVLSGQLHAVGVKADEAKAMAGRAVVLVEGQQERLKSTKGWVVLPPDFAVEVAKLLKEDEAYHPGIKVTDGVGEAVMYWIEIRLHPKKGAGWYQVDGIERFSEVKAENLVSALHRQGGFGGGENRYINFEVPDQVEARSEGFVSGSPVPSGDAATAPSASVNGAESMDPPVATILSGDEKVAEQPVVPVAKGFEPVLVTGPKKVMPSASAFERLVVQRNRQDLK